MPAQPRPGVSPILFGRHHGDAQDLGRLGHGATKKVAELDQLGLAWRLPTEAVQRLVNCQDFQRIAWSCQGEVIRVYVLQLPVAAPFPAPLAAGTLDEDAAHGLGSSREEVAAS